MKKIILVISVVLFVKCNKADKNIHITPFNIENLNNITVKSFKDENLNNQGFNRIVTDLLVYEKKENDTLVQLEFDRRSGKIRTKSWKIKLMGDELALINYIRNKYKVLTFNEFIRRDYEKKLISFPAIKLEDNSVFLCFTSKDDDHYYLNVDYYNPG